MAVTALMFLSAAVVTAFLFWVPTSERWIRAREARRAIALVPMSPEGFERFSATVVRVVAVLITIAFGVKLMTQLFG